MIFLQRSVGYADGVPPTTLIKISVHITGLFFTAEPENSVSRHLGDLFTGIVTQPADRDHYRVAFPDTMVTGPGDDSAELAARFLTASVYEEMLDRLAIPLTISYALADGQALGIAAA